MDLSNFTGYQSCSTTVKNQIENIVNGLQSSLRTDLLGIYLGGSMVLDAFDEKSSDIDMIVIINKDLSMEEKISIISLLLSASKRPCPLDLIFITKKELLSVQHPPIHLFFNNYWEDIYKQILSNRDKAEELFAVIFSGGDVITDIKLIKQSGICLYGMPIDILFPDVSDNLFFEAISSQAADYYVESDNHSQSAYLILQLCRILSYKKTSEIFSKPKAAVWAFDIVPSEFHSVISTALFRKYGIGNEISYTADNALSFKTYVLESIA